MPVHDHLRRTLARDVALFLKRGQCGREVARHLGERYPVLRALRAGERGHDIAQIQSQGLGVIGLGCIGGVPDALRLAVGLDQGDLRLVAPGQAQIVQRDLIDREEAAGGPVLGPHVRDGGALAHRQGRDRRAVELDELADHAVLAQHVDDGQDQVGRGDAFAQCAGQLEADDLGDQHRDRLAQHGCLGLDPAHTPAQDADPIDHGGVRIGADTGVEIGLRAAVERIREDDAR